MSDDFDAAQFRQLMGRFATGVTVITTTDASGALHGMTANSLTSVSLDPPLLLICVDHRASMLAPLRERRGFVVNVLEAHQEALSRRFAGKHEDRFDGIGYALNPEGHACLEGALAHLECAYHGEVEAGDHTIVLGRVLRGAAHDGRPLCYFRGGYAALA